MDTSGDQDRIGLTPEERERAAQQYEERRMEMDNLSVSGNPNAPSLYCHMGVSSWEASDEVILYKPSPRCCSLGPQSLALGHPTCSSAPIPSSCGRKEQKNRGLDP